MIKAARSLFSSVIGYGHTGGRFYDALKDTGSRRRNPAWRVRHGDNKLRDRDRRQLTNKVQQVTDNNAIGSWMARKHTTFVAALLFKPTTPSEEYNLILENWYKWWSRPENCHVQERHSFPELISQMESERFKAGDIFALKVGGSTEMRGRIQLLEGYRIATPQARQGMAGIDLPSDGHEAPRKGRADEEAGKTQFQSGEFVNGVKLDRWGRASHYAVHRAHMDGNLEWERTIRAENMVHLGYFDRPEMVRGVTPLTTALNTLEDIYECYGLIFGKLKLSQTLGAFITRSADGPLDPTRTRAHGDANQDGIRDSQFDFEFDDGVNIFDLEPGEGITTVQDAVSSAPMNDYLELMIATALKAADIPYSFYSEDFTNWFGQRGAINQFRRDVEPKQTTLACALDNILTWRIEMAIALGEIPPPADYGLEMDELGWNWWEWVSRGLGWFDPTKEANGYKSAISAGLDSPKRIARMLGVDWKQALTDRAEFEKAAAALGVTLDLAVSSSSQHVLEDPDAEDGDTEPDDNEDTDDDNADDADEAELAGAAAQ